MENLLQAPVEWANSFKNEVIVRLLGVVFSQQESGERSVHRVKIKYETGGFAVWISELLLGDDLAPIFVINQVKHIMQALFVSIFAFLDPCF